MCHPTKRGVLFVLGGCFLFHYGSKLQKVRYWSSVRLMENLNAPSITLSSWLLFSFFVIIIIIISWKGFYSSDVKFCFYTVDLNERKTSKFSWRRIKP